MKFRIRGWTIFFIAGVLGLGLLSGEGWAQTTKVNFGVTFRNARLAPLWVAQEQGFFKQEGFEVQGVNISGGTQGVQAMVSGSLDVSYDDPISCIVATAGGSRVVDIFAGTPTMPYLVVGAPGVKTITDVKGKRVGSSGLGLSASRLALIVGFKHFGLDVDRDKITLVAAGQEPERIAGLTAGAIAATVISPEYQSKLKPLGLNLLADLRTLNISWETASVVTTASNMQTKRDKVERVLKALLEANAYILDPVHRSRMIEMLTSQLALKSSQEAASVYDDLIRYYVLKKPYPNRQGITNIIAEVGKAVPKAAGLRYEDVADPSIIEKFDKAGFIDGLYK